MALITKPVKVSNRVEGRLEDLLNVDRVSFKRLKFVNLYIFRFTFFVQNKGKTVGTINYFWDIRKMYQWIILRRFSDTETLRLRHLNGNKYQNFFQE